MLDNLRTNLTNCTNKMKAQSVTQNKSSSQYVGKMDFQNMSESDNPPQEGRGEKRGGNRSLFEWKIFVLVLVQRCGWLVIIGSLSSAWAAVRVQCGDAGRPVAALAFAISSDASIFSYKSHTKRK